MEAAWAAGAVARMLEGGPALWLAPGVPPELPADVGAVVATSGSTGDSKPVVLSRTALRSAAASSQQRLGAPLTWHLALAPHYVAGLMVLVRSHAAGRSPVLGATDLSDARSTGEGDALSIVPTQLHRALRSATVTARLAGFDAVLVGGAALGRELRERAEAAGIRIIETYGMSETCGGCVWDGVPLPGVEVRIVPDARAPEGSGRIALGGQMLFDGYLGGEAPAGEFLTGDFGTFDGTHLVVGGRLDDVVITGGVNVDLGRIRRAVEAREPDAAVLAVPDEEWGVRIVLFATHGDLGAWRGALAADLPRSALPRQFVLVDSLPRTAGGKPDRSALLEWVQS
ncbi:AMP-binding protein [Tessaracoccus rhinocerotis]|uniref:AMP-binding protein n=1 Tax=Tessaracoccus rhinocerotis TaxID=1689449 RepID=A0A553K5K3_9ACTN|nr:AMP-binding protein [Tessaracoccus rhinocerotis]TRY19994.1 AMP-binding protein [Tessaracoccus rhinocerotis]